MSTFVDVSSASVNELVKAQTQAVMDSFEGPSKKLSFEDLTKEDLILKYKALLVLAQKAKQAKDTLIKENGGLKESLDEKLAENVTYKKQLHAVTDENNKLVADLKILEEQIESLKQIGLQQQQQLLSLEKLKAEDEDLSSANEKLKEKLRLYHSKIIKFAQDVKYLKQARHELISTFGSYVAQVSDWKARLEILLQHIQENQTRNENLEKEKLKLKGYLYELHTNFGLGGKSEELEAAESLFSILDQQIKKLQKEADDNSKLRTENAELLAEMNEMNVCLKERGETISQQQAYCDKMVEVINQKDELIKSLQSGQETTQEATAKEAVEISKLKDEIEELKNKLLITADEGIADNETMSVSTMSRNDDINRMRDLESSWEERYSKLRNLALKLKKKTTDLSADLAKEQAEKLELQQKLNKTITTFQQQTDMLQDELETYKNDSRTYLKKLESVSVEIAKDKRQLAADEETIAKLKSELDSFNKSKQETDNWKKQVSGKIQALKNEMKANALLKKEFESKITKLTADVEAKEKALKNEMEKHAQTKVTLQESIDEAKRLSLLNLELHDYENVAKDISQELDKKQEIITNLRSQIDTYKVNLNEVQNQKKKLENDFKNLEESASCLKSGNALHVNKLSELEKLLLEKDLRLQNITHSLENSKLENEDLTRQLSEAVVEHEKFVGGLRNKEDQLKSQNLGLEQQLRALQETLKLKEDELTEVRSDYDSYKIRAKSFMQQSRDFGVEEKLTQETVRLKGQVDEFKEEIKELRSTLAQEHVENTTLSLNNEQLRLKNESMEAAITENKRQYEQLLVEHQLCVKEHAEAIRGLQLHIEKLTEYYQQQLLDQKVKHNSEISELQLNATKAPPSNIPSLPPPSMVREEGEGSENADGVANNSNSNVISLEKLLSNESDKDVHLIKKQLTENEIKVTHLTALLADAEQDLAKHVQMNKVLKEEIRRQQRCVEREKHAENLEYLKNIIFKFLTLGNGDERNRLVPVLNTILKLSPEENQKLIMMVSKGDNKGWSSYLPGSWGS